jgi:N-acyl homoserine lactone hydrolase
LEQGFSILELAYMNMPRSIIIKGETEERIRVPVVAFVIRSRDLTLLFDTGVDSRKRDFTSKPGRVTFEQQESNYLQSQLRTLGIEPNAIDAVIISHLDGDHAGFLYTFRKTRTPILIQEREVREAREHGSQRKKEDFDFPDLEYHEIDGDYVIDRGLELMLLPGHKIGLQGLYMETEKGRRAIFASDACYTMQNFGPPAKEESTPWNAGIWHKSLERIRLMMKLRKAELFPGHDPEFYSSKKYAPFVYD